MNKVILPVWDLVRDEQVGMSSVFPMASHSPEEQKEIFVMLKECLDSGESLTREAVKAIVEGYRQGKRTFSELDNGTQRATLTQDGLPSYAFMNTDPPNGSTKNVSDRIDDGDGEPEKSFSGGTQDGNKGGSSTPQGSDKTTVEQRSEKTAMDVLKHLEKLNACFNAPYEFTNEKDAETALRSLAGTFSIVVDEMYGISREHGLGDLFKQLLEEMEGKVKEY